jgi:hypothetical protein
MDSFAEQYRLYTEIVDPPDEEKQRKARLVCAANATDADDLRELLMALGLMDPGFHTRCKNFGNRGVESREKVWHNRKSEDD